MAPKVSKKGLDKKSNDIGAASVNKNWEAALTKAAFEEESWQACVSLVVGESPEDEELTQALSLAVQKPMRKLFSLLTWDSTLAKINELGNPKAKKTVDMPMFYEVTEPAKVLLDAGEKIPCDLMAKILKFQLLRIKANDHQRRKAEQKREAEQADEEKLKASPSPAKKEKKGKSPQSLGAPSKEKTMLKRRGEIEPPKWIDDEPKDGPQHYILLVGFYQPHLIEALDAIGVHVANVIKLCSEHTQTSKGYGQSCRTSLALNAEVHDSAELAVPTRKLDLFWSGLRAVLDSGPPSSKLHDVAQISYTIPDGRHLLDTEDPEAELKMGSRIFEGVANLIYDCLDWRRQHQEYMHNIKLISVPTVSGLDPHPAEDVTIPISLTSRSKKKSMQEEKQPVQMQNPLSTEVDMRYYHNLLDQVPPEACSVPLIVHCMLEQVVISTEKSLSTVSCVAEDKPPSGPGLDYQLVGFMLQRFLPLVHTNAEKSHMLNSLLKTTQNEEDRKRLEEEFGVAEAQKKSQHPLVFRHHNEMAMRLRDISAVQGFDPAEVEVSMMRGSPVWELIQSVARLKDSNSCWMAIKQQLQHYCTDDVVSWLDVERLIHQSVFESMPLTRVGPNGVLQNAPGPLGPLYPEEQQTRPIIPWDNPLSYAKQQFNNLQTKGLTFLTKDPGNPEVRPLVCCPLDLHDIQSSRLRSLFDWHYAEHHGATVLPQVLQLASEDYRCMDTFRGSHNNILYIFCHNPMSPYRQCKEVWDVTLHTNVKFRKYLEYVADTISDWTKEEELKREAMQLRDLSPAESAKATVAIVPGQDETATNSVEDDIVEPVSRKGCLKALKLEKEQLKEEEVTKKSKKEDTTKSQQPKEKPVVANAKKGKTTLSGKSTADSTMSSTKTLTESIATTAHPLEENKELNPTEEPFYAFTGYSMNGKLIHVSGRCQYLFPSDGGHITVENVSYVEGSSLMKVVVKKDGHHFYTHINQVIVDPANPLPKPRDEETSGRKEAVDVSKPVEMKRVKLGSLSAKLDNGIHLSYSFYGPTGEYRVVPQKTVQGGPGTAGVVPIRHSSSTNCSKVTDLNSAPSKTYSPDSQTIPPESQGPPTDMDAQKNTAGEINILTKVCEGQEAFISSPFNSLNLSVPNGLLLQFLREDAQGVSSEEQGMLVKQSFPLHGRGAVGQLQDPSLSKELSRIVTYHGAVIRYMRDGATEVLFADGSVSFSQDSGPVWVPDSEVEEKDTSQETEDNKKEQSLEKEPDNQRGCWLTTTPSGARIRTVGTTHKHIPTTPLLTFKASDPITHEVMLSREDLVVSVQSPDGSLSVEHADGTRITSLYQDRSPSTLQQGEQPESVKLKSTSKCAFGRTDCARNPRRADSNNMKVHVLDACDSGAEISIDSAEKACDGAGAEHAFSGCEHVCNEKESGVDKNGEDSMFTEKNVAKNAKTRGHKSHKESVSTKERVVLVEKEGCPTVVMYPERHTAHVFLADGTVVTGNNQGAYEVFPSSTGLLQIQSDGKCVYSSEPPVTPGLKGCTPTNQPGSYTMSHSGIVACDVTDPDGNHFQVMEDGQLLVLNCHPAPSTLKQNEAQPEEEEGEDREMAKMLGKHREQSFRLFLVHEDGSGTELLSAQTVEELLYQAYSDPTIALLKEPLSDSQDEFAITILKPCHQSVWSQWLLGKQNPDLTPPNLRNRSWHSFPRIEKKSPGPPFGTDMGRGLTLIDRSGDTTAQRQPLRSCPKVLEMRELYQHRSFTTPLKNTIDTRLMEYIEYLIVKEQRSEDMNIKDPRTEEESVHASDLLNMVLSFAEEEDSSPIFEKKSSVVIADIYSQVIGDPTDVSEDTATVASDSFPHIKESKWTERLTQNRQEMSEEQASREALRKKKIVPFFHRENILLYQDLLQHKKSDMKSLSIMRRHEKFIQPPLPKSDSTEAFLKDVPQEKTLRPLSPTPSQLTSHAERSDRMLEKRPSNLTPQTAGEGSVRGSSGQCKSIQVDVTGKLRRTKVRLPTSILGSKPYSVPNQQFLAVEEPVRRKCRTISLTDSSFITRGFLLLPSSVDFGTVQEGTSCAITVVMKNVGVDTCRFHVKQPPPSTGLRVIFNPGPVIAGLQTELQVQLFALSTVQAGEVEPKKYISQDIIIHTETDILYLPVTATILPERLYDIWLQDNMDTHNKRGSRVCRLPPRPPVGRWRRTFPQTPRYHSDQSIGKRGTF